MSYVVKKTRTAEDFLGIDGEGRPTWGNKREGAHEFRTPSAARFTSRHEPDSVVYQVTPGRFGEFLDEVPAPEQSEVSP